MFFTFYYIYSFHGLWFWCEPIGFKKTNIETIGRKNEPSPTMEYTELEILYEDNHLIAVNKPAGVLVQPDKKGDKASSKHLDKL